MWRFILLICALSTALAVWAQPDPDNPQPDTKPEKLKRAWAAQALKDLRVKELPTLLVMTPQGMVAYRRGVLAKYDEKTLQPQGAVIELFGPDNPADAANADAPLPAGQAALKKTLESMQRLFPTAMVVQGNDLLIVCGEQFIRVDLETFTQKVLISLAPANAQVTTERLMSIVSEPTLLATEQTLFVVRGKQLLGVNIADGEVTTRGALPEQMFEKIQPPKRAPKNNPPNAGGAK